MSALQIERNGALETIYTPLAHQARFHASTAPNCIMAGGAGTGKSLAIRYDAFMRALVVPRFRAVILRRSMPELKISQLEQVPFDAHKLGLPPQAWHATDHVLRFPNGSIVKFDHYEDEQSSPRFLSSEYEAIYLDEMATFTLKQFLFIQSRARTSIPNLRPIVRGGTNPVGVGASWVKRFFLDKNVSTEDNPGYVAANYEYIHSTVDDNTYVDLKEYETRLNSLPSEALRRALRHGEWVTEGQAFPEWREALPGGAPWHVIDQLPTYRGHSILDAPHIEIVRVVDWGYSASGNPGMCLWFACLTDGSAIGFKEYVFKETLPADAAAEIRRQSEGLRVRYTVGDTAMWQEHEGPSIAEHFASAGVSMIEADKARTPGWVQLHVWLRETIDTGAAQYPRLRFLRSGCPVTIRTLPQMVLSPKDPSDIETTNVEDEGADCSRYFVMSRPGRSHEKPADPALLWMFKEIEKKKRLGRRLGSEATRRLM